MHMLSGIGRKASRLVLFAVCLLVAALRPQAAEADQHRLYVAVPGIRNEVGWGGVGILVYDMDHGHRLLKRIPTLEMKPGQEAEAVKGVCASAKTGRLYMSTPKRLICLDLNTEQI